MSWSWRVGTIAGIGIYFHWTFLLVIGWILLQHLAAGEGLAAALQGVGFILTIFGCVVLHELGHALMARRFGISTRDITLLPIGGVARLERMPEDPRQELLVAIAGPAVNVVIAATLAVALWLIDGFSHVLDVQVVGGQFLAKILFINLGLVAFNLLPAFPMDGGRVLRALLVPSMGYSRATQAAASVGQFMAILFGIAAFFSTPMLLFIALFVYLGAQQEAHRAQVHSLLHGVPVREAMMTRYHTLRQSDELGTAIYELLAGDQRDFPVVEDQRLVGILLRNDLIACLSRGDACVRVVDAMRPACATVEENAMLEAVFTQMQAEDSSTLPVVRQGRLVGVISLENIGEWMMIQMALQRPPSAPMSPGPPGVPPGPPGAPSASSPPSA